MLGRLVSEIVRFQSGKNHLVTTQQLVFVYYMYAKQEIRAR